MTIYYTYYSYEEFGRGYIGYRKCPEHLTPETDLYLGSYTDKKFKPTQKIILGTYNNRTDAIADEIVLHKAYDVAANLHFANRARMTSVGFSTAGITYSDETRAKMSAAKQTVSKETRAKLSESHRGKTPTLETREKMSKNCGMKRPEVAAKVGEANRGKIITPETREKISKAQRGRTFSEEQRAKLSEAASRRARKCERYTWENINIGIKHDNLCISELQDLYPELHKSALGGVSLGKRKHHKGWRVLP